MTIYLRTLFSNISHFFNASNYLVEMLGIWIKREEDPLKKTTWKYLAGKIVEEKNKLYLSYVLDKIEPKVGKISVNDIDLLVGVEGEPRALFDLKRAPQSEYFIISKAQAETWLKFQEHTDIPFFYLTRLPGGYWNLIKVNVLYEQVKQNSNGDLYISTKQGLTFDKRELPMRLLEILR